MSNTERESELATILGTTEDDVRSMDKIMTDLAVYMQRGVELERARVVEWLRHGGPGLGTGCRGEIKRCADARAGGAGYVR